MISSFIAVSKVVSKRNPLGPFDEFNEDFPFAPYRSVDEDGDVGIFARCIHCGHPNLSSLDGVLQVAQLHYRYERRTLH